MTNGTFQLCIRKIAILYTDDVLTTKVHTTTVFFKSETKAQKTFRWNEKKTHANILIIKNDVTSSEYFSKLV